MLLLRAPPCFLGWRESYFRLEIALTIYRLLLASALLLGGATAADAATTMHLQTDAVACSNKDYYQGLVNLMSDKIYDKYGQEAAFGVMNGICILLKEGQEVTLEKVGFMTGFSRVRPRGEMHGYWVLSGLLQ